MKIILLGAGRLATNLAKELKKVNQEIIQIYSRTKESAEILANQLLCNYTTNLTEIDNNADLYIFALSDNAIEEVLKKLNLSNRFFVHTSGSIEMNIFSKYTKNFGVFYPLQTFTKDKNVDFSNIPMCLEANTSENLKILEVLAKKISSNIYFINSEQRGIAHLGAVFVCNFVNHFYVIGNDILEDNNLSLDILRPLIIETALAVQNNEPIKMQTGAAVRKDKNIINKHLEKLNNYPDWQKMYKFVTDSIFKLQNQKK